jgi:hypothetical protein
MANSISESKLLVLPKTGHAIPIVAPSILLQNLLQFLGPVQATGSEVPVPPG